MSRPMKSIVSKPGKPARSAAATRIACGLSFFTAR